jgi:hypothetical protein
MKAEKLGPLTEMPKHPQAKKNSDQRRVYSMGLEIG